MSRLYLRELLEVAKSEMDVEGHLSRDTGLRILSAFCMWDEAFACACAASSARAAETTTSTDVGDKEAIHERALLLEAIDVRLEMIRLFEKRAQERRTLEEAQSLSLPAADVIDKLIRYESHLDRQLYRAMDQLERLQRQRRGENVPPPAVVDVSVHASASSLPEALEKSADSGIANSVPALLEQPKAMSGDVDADVHADTGVVDSKPAPLGLPKAVPGSEE